MIVLQHCNITKSTMNTYTIHHSTNVFSVRTKNRPLVAVYPSYSHAILAAREMSVEKLVIRHWNTPKFYEYCEKNKVGFIVMSDDTHTTYNRIKSIETNIV
jgi:hypothetical protein